MSKTVRLPLSFERGLADHLETSMLSPGQAQRLQNWIPEGRGLRARVGWLNASEVGANLPATRKSRGLGSYVTSGGTKYILAAHDLGTGYRMLALDRSNISGGTWTLIENTTTSPSSRPVAMAAGMGVVLYATPEFASSRIRKWNGSAASDAETTGRAGRALAYYLNRFWSGGVAAAPSTLYLSAIADASTWTDSVNVNADDGEPIEDLLVWDDGLVIGKENSVWYLAGRSTDTFAVYRLDGPPGFGAAPGRTIVPTPRGLIVVGREAVWLFDGAEAGDISKPIASDYGMSGNYMSGAFIDRTLYVCDAGSGKVWALDIDTLAWRTEPFGTANEGPAVVGTVADHLIAGTKESTENSILLYRVFPGSTRQRDAGAAETFRATTGLVFPNGAEAPATLAQLYLLLRQRGGDASMTGLSVTVTPYIGGVAQEAFSKVIDPRDGTAPLVFRERLDPHVEGEAFEVDLAQTVGASETAVFDIEDASAVLVLAERR